MLWRRLALTPIALIIILGGPGWFYLVRATGLPGPRIAEALPLDELARHSSVPLLWFVAVWTSAGVLLGTVARWAGLQRSVAAFVLAVTTGLLLYLTTGVSLAITRQVPARAALHVAERLQAIYLPAVLVALSAALIGRPRVAGRRSPAIVATVVAAAATLELLHTVLPGEGHGVLRDLTPDAVGPLSRATGAFAGVALLFASRGLARRRRRAWQLAVTVAALSTCLHVLHGLNQGTLVSTFVLILLVARRQDFDLPGDRQTRWLIATRGVAALAAIFAFGCVSLWVNRVAADQPFTIAFGTREIVSALLGLHLHGSPHLSGSFGKWFPLSLFLLGVGTMVWIVVGWLAPWRHRVRQEGSERKRVEELVHRCGTDTLSPFTLRRDKSYFLDPEGRAFLAYRVVGGVAIVSGDPVGEPDSFPPLVASFIEYAHRRDWRIAVLGVSERRLGLYRVNGLNALYHGDEAIVDTGGFALEGRAIRKVRQSVNRVERAGYRVAIVQPDEIDADLRRELEGIATAWRAGQPERGFAMSFDALFATGSEDAVFFLGRDAAGHVQGFLHFAIARASDALSLSSMPRLREATPNGFNEWLICEAVSWASNHGYRHVSLNFSPFAALLGGDVQLTVGQELQRRALLTVKGHFQLDNLLAFNRKFFPRWERRFLVYERRLDLPRVGIAALAAEAYLPFQATRR
jgi:lysyl-tRNA synthetase, class II